MFGTLFGRSKLPQAQQTNDTEENRLRRYAVWRIGIRIVALLAAFAEVVLIGPTLPLWLALAGLAVGLDQVRIVLDTQGPCDLVIRPKDNLRQNPRFLGLFALAVITAVTVRSGHWFPLTFRAHDGHLWWVTATGTGRILPSLGAFAVWVRGFLLVGIPLGLWDPITILDWVYRVESVWPNYRNATFTAANPSSVQTPMGKIQGAPVVKQEPAPIPVKLASPAPLPARNNGGNGHVQPVEQRGSTIDL